MADLELATLGLPLNSLWIVLVVGLFEYFEMEMVEEMKKMMNSIEKEIRVFLSKDKSIGLLFYIFCVKIKEV